jgi:hypothetical protein
MSEKAIPLPPPCPLCAPNDASWMETPTGLKRCTGTPENPCPRGAALLAEDTRRRLESQAKARKAADKAAAEKEAKLKRWREERKSQNREAARYRDLPLMAEEQED